jgi:hypothetical protein
MRMCKTIVSSAAALTFMSLAAQAQVLTVVEVGAPAVNCVFNPSCTITVSDTLGFIPLPYLAAPQTAWLQSRTFTGASGTPGAGKTGYMYRISLTQAAGTADCLGGLVVNFGPVAKLPYKNNQLADVFVVTTGGLGTISLKSAEKFANVIEFTLAKQLCLAGGPDQNNTTFFFGLAADTAPMPITAQIFSTGSPPLYNVGARVPTH